MTTIDQVWGFLTLSKDEADNIIEAFDLLAKHYDNSDIPFIQFEKQIINYKGEIHSYMQNYNVELPKHYIYKQMAYITRLSRDIDRVKVIKDGSISIKLYCCLLGKLVTLIRKRMEILDLLEEQLKKWNSIKSSRNKNQKKLIALIEDKISNLIDVEEEFNLKANLLANTYEDSGLFAYS